MRFTPLIGEHFEFEATTIEIEDSGGPIKGEHLRFNEKGVIEYQTAFYVVRVEVNFTQ
ncbi:MAG: hypothetical protein HYX37_10395 [Rhizobiales bacterium]|nr:hypothetical protein [Hyphomicrobiales bacterium]